MTPARANLEILIKLRNKIEHRFLPELDSHVFGECQSCLFNYEKLLIKTDDIIINEMMENYSRCINSWTGDDYFIGIIDYFSESETSFVYHVSTFSVPSDEELISFNDFFDEHDLWRFVDWKPNLLLINFCY